MYKYVGVRRDPWGVCGGTPAAHEDLVWVRKGIIGAAVGILDTHIEACRGYSKIL